MIIESIHMRSVEGKAGKVVAGRVVMCFRRSLVRRDAGITTLSVNAVQKRHFTLPMPRVIQSWSRLATMEVFQGDCAHPHIPLMDNRKAAARK